MPDIIRVKTLTALLALLCLCALVRGGEKPPVNLPSRENFHLLLLAGQSNSAGRGTVAE